MTDLLGMNAILVLGMHRSGTSALARILNLLGCDLGPNLLPAAADNEAGFWEHRDVVLLDDEVLARLGSRWDDPRPIAPERFADPALDPLRQRAHAILTRDFAGKPLWGMKDPRLCRLLPFWLPVITSVGATPRCVLALRHPADVARSLRIRNGFSAVRSERLWLAYVMEAEHATRGLPRSFIAYDQIVEDWRTHLPRVARELGVFQETAIAHAADNLARFIDPELRHHGAHSRRGIALRETHEAWAALLRGSEAALDEVAPAAAREASRHRDPLVSIVVVTRNGMEHTRRCLDSVARNTPEPHEVIVVDNGSTDGTVAFLEERARHDSRLRVITNGANRGFASANNQGLAIGRGQFYVALNNDVIVSPGWLTRMLAVMEECLEVGIVGPTTNRASGPQVVPAGYTTLAEMEAHARTIARNQAGETDEARRLVAFCWLVRRSLVDRIGGFDERFETGNCEDDDFCLRTAQAGYRARIARDCFVHHEGSATFREEKIDYAALMHRNFDVFKAKWGMDPAARPEDGYPFVDLAAQADRPRIPLPAPDSKVRLQAGILAEHEPIPAVRAFFEQCGHARVPRWASAAALDDELQRGNLVLVLGGDVHMTQDALRGLVAILHANPKIAAVGPVSNAAPELQRAAPKYGDLDRDLRRFSERRAKKYFGIWHDAPSLGAFCVLLRGEPARTVGGLPRELPIAEALAEFFHRVRSAGFRVACAPGVYVHHAKWTADEDFVRSIESRSEKREGLMMCSLRVLAASVAAFALAGSALATTHTFNVSLDASQEVPPNGSPATGTATVFLDTNANTMEVDLSFSGLVAPQTAAHLHGPAPQGVNAGVLVGFPTGQLVNQVFAITDVIEGHMLGGLTYINVHTQTFPGGEIRGQLLLPVSVESSSWARVKQLYR